MSIYTADLDSWDRNMPAGVHRAAPVVTDAQLADLIERNAADPVEHPKHYTSHPSGVECIQVTEHMTFCLGNAVKYLWRAGLKGPTLEDLKKARWYIDREIERLSSKS